MVTRTKSQRVKATEVPFSLQLSVLRIDREGFAYCGHSGTEGNGNSTLTVSFHDCTSEGKGTWEVMNWLLALLNRNNSLLFNLPRLKTLYIQAWFHRVWEVQSARKETMISSKDVHSQDFLTHKHPAGRFSPQRIDSSFYSHPSVQLFSTKEELSAYYLIERTSRDLLKVTKSLGFGFMSLNF